MGVILAKTSPPKSLEPAITENKRNKAKYLTWVKFKKKTKRPVKSFQYIKCYSSSSPRPIKSPSNSIRYTTVQSFLLLFLFNWDSLHARLYSHYEAWSYKKSHYDTWKAFYRQRIPEFSHARKRTVDIDIFVTSRNGGRKIMQSFRLTSRPPSRKRKWNQLSQF